MNLQRRMLSALLLALLILPLAGCKRGDTDEESATTSEDTTPRTLNTLSPAEIADGWLLLFDGKTLGGWEATNKGDNWSVQDGCIRAVPKEGATPGIIHTTTTWSDFVLKLDFKSAPKIGNSGVFFRSDAKPDDKNLFCYEVNIADWGENAWPTGSLVHHKKTTRACDSADWQTMTITAEKGMFKVAVDGEEVLSYACVAPHEKGFIGLQYRAGEINFRNIRIKPLELKPLIPAGTPSLEKLQDWKLPAKGGVATLNTEKSAKVLTLQGSKKMQGADYIQLPGEYGDFLFSSQVKLAKEGVNSGVFYRCIDDTGLNGYEVQIETLPSDAEWSLEKVVSPTGGIARRALPTVDLVKPGEWFQLTVAASGPNVVTWINGTPVCSWTDERKEKPNPRSGLRTKPGTIKLQIHDANTDLQFKDLRIRKER